MSESIIKQYDNSEIAKGFAALELGREKFAIGQSIIGFVTQYYKDVSNSTAVILGVGTGWEVDLLHQIGFNKIVGYDPGAAMLARAQKHIEERNYTNVTLFDTSKLEDMNRELAGTADLVIGTHVIPAIGTRDDLVAHFKQYRHLLTANGFGLAVTNNPADQFHGFDSYGCFFDGQTPSDGMRVRTMIHDVKIGGTDVEINEKSYTVGGKTLMVIDTFWSQHGISSAIQDGGMKLVSEHLIDLQNENEPRNISYAGLDESTERLFSPYRSFVIRKPAIQAATS